MSRIRFPDILDGAETQRMITAISNCVCSTYLMYFILDCKFSGNVLSPTGRGPLSRTYDLSEKSKIFLKRTT